VIIRRENGGILMHYIERKLFLAVRDKQDIRSLIWQMDDCYESHFNTRDPLGNTILHHAILYKSRQSFEMLFEHLKNDRRTLFQTNGEGHTIFSLALSRGEQGYAQYIFEGIETNFSLKKVIDSFFLVQNVNLFQFDLQRRDPAFFNFLIEKLKHHPDFIKILNHPDKNKNTGLHLALRTKDKNQIAWLLNSGADFCKPNKAGKTATAIMEENNLLFEIFNMLDKTSKEAILKFYRLKSFHDLDDIETKALYLKLSSLHSLRARVQAELEFNPKVPLQTDTNPKKQIPAAILYSGLIPPFYRHRIVEIENELNIVHTANEQNGLYDTEQRRLEQIYWRIMTEIENLKSATQDHKSELHLNHFSRTNQLVHHLKVDMGSVLELTAGLFPFLVFALVIVIATTTFLTDAIILSLILGVFPFTLPIVFGLIAAAGVILENSLKKAHAIEFADFINELLELKTTMLALKNPHPGLQEILDEIDKQIQALKDVDVCSNTVCPANQVKKILDQINASLTDIGFVSLTQTGEISYSIDDRITDLDQQPAAQDKTHSSTKNPRGTIGFFNGNTEQNNDHSPHHEIFQENNSM